MSEKNLVFFSGIDASTDNQQESPIERVKKYIDKEIAYKKILAEQLLNNNPEDIWNIVISNTQTPDNKALGLSKKLKNAQMVKLARKGNIGRTIEDLKDFNRLKNSVEADSVDYLYLNIYFLYQLGLMDIENDVTRKYFYNKSDVKQLVSNINQDIPVKDIQASIMASLNLKKEMLTILETEISPYCLQFLKDVKVACIMKCYSLEIRSEANTRFDNFNIYLNSTLPNSRSENLIKEYNSAIDTLSQESTVYRHSTLNDSYLKIFERMKVLYQLEDKITEMAPIYSTIYQPFINVLANVTDSH